MIHRAFGHKAAAIEVPTPPQPLETLACYRYCEAMARARHHNFPVASLFMPRALRPHMFALYAFARAADDFADEPQYAGRRALELDRWEEHLRAMFHNEVPVHPVFVALSDTVTKFDLPITPFSALLTGYRSDLERNEIGSEKELRDYTELTAAPVAQLYLYLSGYRQPDLHRYAADLATGLAYANFWQDLSVDLDRGRLYVPAEDLSHFGLVPADLFAGRRGPKTTALIRYLVARTRAVFERARPLVNLIDDKLAVETALMWLGGTRILDKIERAGDTVLTTRPRLRQFDKAQVVTAALAWRGGSLARRAAQKL